MDIYLVYLGLSQLDVVLNILQSREERSYFQSNRAKFKEEHFSEVWYSQESVERYKCRTSIGTWLFLQTNSWVGSGIDGPAGHWAHCNDEDLWRWGNG